MHTEEAPVRNHAATKTEIKITGMTCAMCAKAIEKALTQVQGVSGAEVNLGKETASVEYDQSRVKLADLEAAVRDAGIWRRRRKGCLAGGRHDLRDVRW